MTTYTHRDIAHRHFELLINNATDELHDRARDDIADATAPHLDALIALCCISHDADCDDMTTTDADDLDIAAFELDDDTIPCISTLNDAIYTLLYRAYND